MVHVDYTAKGGPLRLESLLPEEADRLKQTPFAVIQVTASNFEASAAPALLHHSCLVR